MKWNWQQSDWTQFTYKKEELTSLEEEFLHGNGVLIGAKKYLSTDEQNSLKIELISTEALKTSEIEGEFLDRNSVQSSIQYQFGLIDHPINADLKEQGIAEMMTSLYLNFDKPLTGKMLFEWHTMLTKGTKLKNIGKYRTNKADDPMWVMSGPTYKPKIHFEAPPSATLKKEMKQFLEWFKHTAPKTKTPLSPIVRSGMAHLYFVSIHPFEDGNGRVARAISEKALAQALGEPSLIALAYTIQQERKSYYDLLERANKSNEITEWLIWFSQIIIKAQQNTLQRVEFLIEKTKLYDSLRGQLNERQEKVLERIFREGIDGFTGGLSANNYMSITKASAATTTRDLSDLVTKGALIRIGELKHTRYHLPFVKY